MIKKILGWFSKPVAKLDLRPPAPCGNNTEHYFWTSTSEPTLGCPVCFANEQGRIRRKEEAEKEERLAKLIADKVLDGLKGTK